MSDSVARAMPASIAEIVQRMAKRSTPLVPIRVGEATGLAMAYANVTPREWQGAYGWMVCGPDEAAHVARQCLAASKRDRRDPWPNGYRTALGRLAAQIDARLQGERT